MEFINGHIYLSGFEYDQIRHNLENSLQRYGHKVNFKRPNDTAAYDIYLMDGYIKIRSKTGKEYEFLSWDQFLYPWLEKREEYD